MGLVKIFDSNHVYLDWTSWMTNKKLLDEASSNFSLNRPDSSPIHRFLRYLPSSVVSSHPSLLSSLLILSCPSLSRPKLLILVYSCFLCVLFLHISKNFADCQLCRKITIYNHPQISSVYFDYHYQAEPKKKEA
ncbi:hypothetical protein ACET3Z_017214 [Daucus carota]